ncbi:invasion associated locus B family protein [Bradyrhizobium sp. Ash2021]|jgi:invasion protein IalB|uniref:invasion associated locus B family protein n=1 Tax=Bradyrhizobium sp. Ash2021 TaxID=2954771 RepID=UPI002815CF7F|nr:invasion associated locus B family protein [Bradyrhizobium sp. Ash2021]WMT73766.1 invasion associated locus B family protein [Bradyrhizobium sp. Ash2021]
MNLQTARSINSPEAWRSVLVAFMALGISMAGTVANSQQVIPFGDVPATADFSEAEIAARGQQKLPNLTYSTWKKLCFRGAQGADAKMVCRTSIEGKSDLGQIILKVDLIEREDAPSTRLQIFVPTGNLLQPGIRLTVDKGASILVPYTICLANGCVAATVPEPKLLSELETGRMLSLEAVNSNVVTVIASLSLDNFASARQGVAAQVFEQKLEGNWERPTDEGNRK